MTNTATATNGTTTSPSDSATVTADQQPALTIDKSATPATYDSVGDVISYSYVVSNSGNVTLAGPFTVSDDKASDEACPPAASLAPAASITSTASYTITQADLDAGSLTNIATASAMRDGQPVTSAPDAEKVTAAQGAALGLVKSAEGRAISGRRSSGSRRPVRALGSRG